MHRWIVNRWIVYRELAQPVFEAIKNNLKVQLMESYAITDRRKMEKLSQFYQKWIMKRSFKPLKEYRLGIFKKVKSSKHFFKLLRFGVGIVQDI